MHDVRVLIRRLRTAAMVFEPYTAWNKQRQLHERLHDIGAVMGDARDLDVWRERFEGWLDRHGPPSEIDIRYRRQLHAMLHTRQQALRLKLDSGTIDRILRDFESLAAGGCSRCGQNQPDPILHLSAELARYVWRAVRARPKSDKPHALHAFRSHVRRARYVAELAQPLVGQRAVNLKRVLTDLNDALGDIHDMDVAAEKLRARNSRAPHWVGRLVNKRRRLSLRRYDKSWNNLLATASVWPGEKPMDVKLYRKESTMIRIYIVRHGISQDLNPKDKIRDEDRELTNRGKARTTAVARGLTALKWTPGVILSSPLARAGQTARILARHAATHPKLIQSVALAPSAQVAAAVALLRKQTAQEVAVVGHMPGLGKLVSTLLCGAAMRMDLVLKKAAVCCIEFDSEVASGSGRLAWLLQPKHLGVWQ